jgi:hypothetical protein
MRRLGSSPIHSTLPALAWGVGMAGFVLRTVLYVALIAPLGALAQGNGPPGPAAPLPFNEASFLTSREVIVALCILVFGLLMTIIAAVLLTKTSVPPGEVLRLFALLVIVTGTLFLVASGYSANDIAPSMGLLGTIAGYLLGRTSSTPVEKKEP